MKRIHYILTALIAVLLCACGNGSDTPVEAMNITASMELKYAQEFSIDYCADGCAILSIAEDTFLVVPDGTAVPTHAENMKVLQKPIENIYLAGSAIPDHFICLDALDRVGFTGTKAVDWQLPVMAEAVESGKIKFVGKYSAPDYEYLLGEGCTLAIENTMIYHNPEVREKLEKLGIPVIVERSGMEVHPLGRMEWIKVYGLLLDKEKEAEEFFDGQLAMLGDIENTGSTGKTVAFFYISSNGTAVVRKSDDYVARMIELAGGEYVFSKANFEGGTSTANMQMESFYAGAKDADVLIYNSTIDGEIHSVNDLLSKSSLLADFKAVQNGNVWCSGRNMFQEVSASAGMIADIKAALSGTAEDELGYMFRVK